MTGSRGFTMLEIVAVLLVLSILATVVGTRFSSSAIELQTTVDRLKGHIRYAQSRAMNTETSWGIELAADRYALFRNGSTANRVRLPGEQGDDIQLPTGYSESVGVVVFDTWGVPYTDAATTVRQNSERKITITAPSEAPIDISIIPNTGFVQ